MGDKEVYVELPSDLPEEWKEKGKVCKLIKFLYGQVNAPRVWYKTLSTFLLDYGFEQAGYDGCTYIMKDKNSEPLLIL
eukprot:2858705-Rhodomonas_salina.1